MKMNTKNIKLNDLLIIKDAVKRIGGFDRLKASILVYSRVLGTKPKVVAQKTKRANKRKQKAKS